MKRASSHPPASHSGSRPAGEFQGGSGAVARGSEPFRSEHRRREMLATLREHIRAFESSAGYGAAFADLTLSSPTGVEDVGPSPGMPPHPGSASSALPPPPEEASCSSGPTPPALSSKAEPPMSWTLGIAAVDRHLSGASLSLGGVHDIKPSTFGDWPAALAFALRLAVRRRLQSSPAASTLPMLWCWPSVSASEFGRPHAPGLRCLGLRPEDVLIVETSRQADILWAMEEGLRSGAFSLVIGHQQSVALTPSRRLALAAAETQTPCLLLTAPGTDNTPASATRWRIARMPSAPHPLIPEAPGHLRSRISLERSRGGPPLLDSLSFDVEWSDVSHRFHMVSGLADRAAGSRESWLRPLAALRSC